MGAGVVGSRCADTNTLGLLDLSAAPMRVYSPAMVIAESFLAMVALGLANSRIKGLHDLWTQPVSVDFDMGDLEAAIRGAFARRDAIVPAACPVSLSEEPPADPAKMALWSAHADQGTAARGGHCGDLGLA